MSKKYKKFYHGKGISKNDTTSRPLKAEPNSFIDSYLKEDGRFSSSRKFNSNDDAFVDLDIADHHRPYDHAHDLINVKDFHTTWQNPSKFERHEMNKAKKKRRFK